MRTNRGRELCYLTDGGMETNLIFDEGQDLPEFAAFHLLREESGRELTRDYYRKYLRLASEFETGFILGTPTWRSNPEWGQKIGYDGPALLKANKDSVSVMSRLRDEFTSEIAEIVISGCVGPRGDGYRPSEVMTRKEARDYHRWQIEVLAESGAETICAMTLNYVGEAVGIVDAASEVGVPVVISYTVETDGCLATGESIGAAIERTDACTNSGADYFMINCAHPVHFEQALRDGGDWLDRIGGIRANASRLSHEELDECESLDNGDPIDLAARMAKLHEELPGLEVFGGCCGTDDRHVRAIAEAIVPSRRDASAG